MADIYSWRGRKVLYVLPDVHLLPCCDEVLDLDFPDPHQIYHSLKKMELGLLEEKVLDAKEPTAESDNPSEKYDKKN